MEQFSILMVCTGNICRSPTADGVMRKKVEQAGLAHCVKIDSAGTTDYHVGEAPDRRAQLHAKKRGYDLGFLRAREVKISDFSQFDLILAMDKSHFRSLQHQCPPDLQYKIQLFLDFANKHSEDEVPDPYYGGADGFEHVLNLVEDGCEGLLLFTIDQLNN